MRNFIPCFICFFLLAFTPALDASEKIVLQLKWEHEFQFAGYYAAKWQGFYDDEGLDVEIIPASRPDGTLVSPIKEVIEGRAQFSIGALDILIEKDRGADLVVLAPIFQRSPNALFALPGTKLNSVRDLIGLRIATPKGDFTKAEVQALLSAHGIDPSSATFVDEPPTIEVLIKGTADVIATYSISALNSAQEHNLTLTQLSLADFGLEFYGDSLYCHQRTIDSDPEMVEKFTRASIRGWNYAMEHKEEIAEKISTELPRHLFSYKDLKAYNLLKGVAPGYN